MVAGETRALRGRTWGFLVLATLLSVGVQGYRYGASNHAYQLPLVLRMGSDPALAGDPLLRTLDVYFAPLLFAVRRVLDFLPAAPTYLAAFLLVRFGLLAGLYRLALALFADRRIAAGLVILALPRPDALVGAEQISWNHFTHTAPVYPLLAFALAFLLEKRLLGAALCGALALHCNPVMAGVPLVACALALACERQWSTLLRLLAALLVLAGPLAFWLLRSFEPGETGADWIRAAEVLVGSHLFPSSFGAGEWAKTLGILGFGLVLGRRDRGAPGHRILQDLVPLVLLLTALAWLLTEVVPVPLVMRLHLPRCVALGALVAHLYLARWLAVELPARGAAPWSWLLLAACLAHGATAPLFFAWIPWTLGRVAPTLRALRPCDGARRIAWGASACLAVTAVAFYVASGATAQFRPVVAVLLACAPLAHLASRDSRASVEEGSAAAPLAAAWRVLAALALLLAVGRTCAFVRQNGWMTPRDPWAETQYWARRSTPADSVFLTPPQRLGFRALSRRSSFVDWKDGCALLWADEYLDEWLRRLAALGLAKDEVLQGHLPELLERLSQAWRELDDADLRRLAAEEGLSFAVREAELVGPDPGFEVAYQNQGFVVLDLRTR